MICSPKFFLFMSLKENDIKPIGRKWGENRKKIVISLFDN